jgi:hypothetical protein
MKPMNERTRPRAGTLPRDPANDSVPMEEPTREQSASSGAKGANGPTVGAHNASPGASTAEEAMQLVQACQDREAAERVLRNEQLLSILASDPLIEDAAASRFASLGIKKGTVRELVKNHRRRAASAGGAQGVGSITLQRRQSDGEPVASRENVLRVLRGDPDLAGLASFNIFNQKIEYTRGAPWGGKAGEAIDECGVTRVAAYFEKKYGLHQVSDQRVWSCLAVIAKENERHPVREYLDGLKWDGKKRLGDFAEKYFATAPSDYTRRICRWFLISAVARAYEPGVKVDHMLTLEGEQGLNKGEALSKLFGEDWHREFNLDLGNKDFYQCIQGVWCVELGELASLNRSDVETMKQALSRRVDRYRPPYDRLPRDVPRSCVFVATTNKTKYLSDPTGNRRFWPIACKRIDLTALQQDRDQLWAEARDAFRAGERFWPEGDEVAACEKEQEERRHEDAWESIVRPLLVERLRSARAAAALDPVPTGELEPVYVTTHDVLIRTFGAEKIGQAKKGDAMRAAEVLRTLGCENTKKRARDDTRSWLYLVPEELLGEK